MTQIKKITDKQGNDIYLRTHTKAVVDDNGYTAESRLQAMQDEINQAQLAVGAIPSDLTPTENSTNWVTSGGVYNIQKRLINNIGGDVDIDTSKYSNIAYVISPSDKKWYSANSNQASKVIPIPEGVKQIKLTPTSSVMMWSLLSDYIEPSRTGISVQTIATGLEARYSSNEYTEITNLSNAKYIVLRSDTGEDMAECPYIVFTYSGEIDYKIDRIKKIAELYETVSDYNFSNPNIIDLATYPTVVGSLATNKQWVTSGTHKAIPVAEGDKYIVTGDGNGFWGWLTNSYTTSITHLDSVPYVSGYDRVLQNGGICVTVPSGASYLVITVTNGSGVHSDMGVYKVDDYVWKHSNELIKFKMATWNIGCFKYYNYKTVGQTSDISDANADSVALEYRQMINKIGADILGVCEYAPKYPRASSSDITRDIILSCFKNAYIGTYYSMASCNAVFFNPFVYVSTSEKVFTRTVKKEVDSSAAQRYYKDVVLNIAGIMVHIVEVHLDHSYTEIRTSQIQEVISDMNVYDHVIIAGDFNTNDLEHLDTETSLFTSAGYVIANNGYIGLYQTNEDGHKIDNIASKGFAMSNIQVYEDAGNLSDHWIVSCDLTILI